MISFYQQTAIVRRPRPPRSSYQIIQILSLLFIVWYKLRKAVSLIPATEHQVEVRLANYINIRVHSTYAMSQNKRMAKPTPTSTIPSAIAWPTP
jgi:hypothetical protein